MTGPEKLKLFQNINIDEILPNSQDSVTTQKLLKDFLAIAELLSSSNKDEINIEEFSRETKVWLELFLYVPDKACYPLHACFGVACSRGHVWCGMVLRLYETICPFTQQGLEKLNDKTTKDFFRSTNQRGVGALFQLVQKRNRIEYLEDTGSKREASKQHCTNCFEPNHNIKTCSTECSKCQYKPCCSPDHLKKIEGHWLKKCMLL